MLFHGSPSVKRASRGETLGPVRSPLEPPVGARVAATGGLAAARSPSGGRAPEVGWDADEASRRAREVLGASRAITVLTGAGISTDSGIPDYRGPTGRWTLDPGAGATSKLADYLSDPGVRARAWRDRLVSPVWSARPNAGHRALVDLERQGRLRALLTQNIDRLHQRAGSSEEAVVELHGSMFGVRCWSCDARATMTEALEAVRAGDPDPHCPACGGVLGSTAVSFGQPLDPAVLARAEQAATDCDAFVAVGTTLRVNPAAALVPRALEAGAAVVIVNADPTPHDALAEAVVRAPIGEVLPRLLAAPEG